MEIVKTPNGDAQTGMSAQEKQEMKIAFEFAADGIKEIQRLVHKIEAMWGIRLWWDSTTSNDDWRWYHYIIPFRFSTSDREDVIKQINSYLEFYQDMSDISSKIHKEEAKSEAEKEKLKTDVAKLREKLQNILKVAKSSKNLASSSTAYRFHCRFINNYKKMECMVKDMQLVSLKQAAETANRKIDSLAKQLEDFNGRYDDLKKNVQEKVNEQKEEYDQKLAEQKREQDRKLAEQKREQDQKLAEQKSEQDRQLAEQKMEQDRQLAEQKREQDRKLAEQKMEQERKLAEQREQMSEDRRKFEETLTRMEDQNKQILEHLRNVLQRQTKLEEDKRKLEEEKDRLEIENDFLLVMNSNLPETTDDDTA